MYQMNKEIIKQFHCITPLQNSKIEVTKEVCAKYSFKLLISLYFLADTTLDKGLSKIHWNM